MSDTFCFHLAAKSGIKHPPHEVTSASFPWVFNIAQQHVNPSYDLLSRGLSRNGGDKASCQPGDHMNDTNPAEPGRQSAQLSGNVYQAHYWVHGRRPLALVAAAAGPARKKLLQP